MASVRRNRTRRRRRFGLLFKLLCGAALAAAATLGATVFFQVETIAVTGNSRYSAEEIIAASGIELGDNMFWMSKSYVGGQIAWQLPYVNQVEIRRGLPSTLTIQVTEWAAAASIQVYQDPEEPADGADEENEEDGEEKPALSDRPWLISRTGKLLEPAPEDAAVPAVTGLTLYGPQPGTMVSVPDSQHYRLEVLRELLDALEEREELDQVSSIDLTRAAWVGMRYQDRFWVRLPLGQEMTYSLKVLDAVAENQLQELGPQAAGTIDLTLSQEGYAAVFTPEGA